MEPEAAGGTRGVAGRGSWRRRLDSSAISQQLVVHRRTLRLPPHCPPAPLAGPNRRPTPPHVAGTAGGTCRAWMRPQRPEPRHDAGYLTRFPTAGGPPEEPKAFAALPPRPPRRAESPANTPTRRRNSWGQFVATRGCPPPPGAWPAPPLKQPKRRFGRFLSPRTAPTPRHTNPAFGQLTSVQYVAGEVGF